MNNQMRTVAKVWGAACFAICAGLGQSETSSLSESLAAVSIPTTAARPLHWVNQHECDGGQARLHAGRFALSNRAGRLSAYARWSEPSDYGRREPARTEQPRNPHSDYGRRFYARRQSHYQQAGEKGEIQRVTPDVQRRKGYPRRMFSPIDERKVHAPAPSPGGETDLNFRDYW